MTAVGTHVLDLERGVPAAGLTITLDALSDGARWVELGRATTNTDGRAEGLAGPAGAQAGVHRLTFAVGAYRRSLGADAFLDAVSVSFAVGDEQRLHIPLLLSPFGVSIYRGS